MKEFFRTLIAVGVVAVLVLGYFSTNTPTKAAPPAQGPGPTALEVTQACAANISGSNPTYPNTREGLQKCEDDVWGVTTTPPATAVPPAVIATSVPPAQVNTQNVPACADHCFARDDANRKLIWNGLKDGTTSIVTSGEFLPLVRSGYAVEFEVTIKGYLEWCQGKVINMATSQVVTTKANCVVGRPHDQEIFHLEAGRYRVEDSLGDDDGGFSWIPELGTGWQAVVGPDVAKCWRADSGARTITWTCATDGTITVTTSDPVSLGAMKSGWTAVINTDRPGTLDFCAGGVRVDGKVVGERKNCTNTLFSVAKGVVTVSTDGYPMATNLGGLTWRPQ